MRIGESRGRWYAQARGGRHAGAGGMPTRQDRPDGCVFWSRSSTSKTLTCVLCVLLCVLRLRREQA